jgi:cobalamin synthase
MGTQDRCSPRCHRRAALTSRLGGITGRVLGAAAELAAASLVVTALR